MPILVRLTSFAVFVAMALHGSAKSAFEQSTPPDATVQTLAAPGPYTNLLFTLRAITPDKSKLRQTRIWIAETRARVLREEVSNDLNVSSLLDVKEESWERAVLVAEIMRTEFGAFVRRKWTPEWGRSVREAEERAKAKGGVFTPSRPEDWRPTDGIDLELSSFNIAASSELRRMKDSSVAETDRGQLVYQSKRDAHRLKCEIQFDPVTKLKLHERKWVNGELLEELRIQTNVVRVPTDFPLTKEEVRPFLERTQAQKHVGFGFLLEARRPGYFVIRMVAEGSPASNAGIEAGSVLLAIDSKRLDALSISDVYYMLKRPDGERVTIQVQSASSSETKTYQLKAAEFIAQPMQRTHGTETAPAFRGLILDERPVGPFLVRGVLSDSPADEAGVESGSLIIGVNGKTTTDMPQANFIALLRTRQDLILDTLSSTTRETKMHRLKPGLPHP